MTNEPNPLSQQEHSATICVCVLAAFADGAQSEDERVRIYQIKGSDPHNRIFSG
jgi:tellurite resistance protein